ncbi:hypothetical protein Micbo1qcDRAFT_225782 [Microdochium bolleyi]|uniref:Ubiquitin 3 binding protein But2 C-terminal domain-domain-containing protein n=1 Tax=Microdochium bolleyi TaxID=196109 RepID=A0A136J106_9PEZI|nr:hypothetical protein Micbo1qcDRAFT_225782 [Microdochium bolleyi]
MKLAVFASALVATTSAIVLPARHTLNEICFHISARTAPWNADAEEVPLGRDFEYGDFCFDNRFKTLRNAKHQQCSMAAPDYRLECSANFNGTTRFEISYPAADGPPYLTYDNAPGIFYACPADSQTDYTFDVFSAKAPFGSVCLPITLTLEPAEPSCPEGNGTASNATMTATAGNSTMTRTRITSSASSTSTEDETSTEEESSTASTSSEGRTIGSITASTTTSDDSASAVTLSTETPSSTSQRSATITSKPTSATASSLGRPIFSTLTASANSTFSAGGNSTAFPTRSFAANMTGVPPIMFVPTTESAATEEATATQTAPSLSCRVPTSAPSIAPWRIRSSSPGTNPTFGNAAEVVITDKNSTILEYVIPADFGVPVEEGTGGGDDDTMHMFSGTGRCALQFRMPFCNDLAPGYPCYHFSGTTQEVQDDSGMLLELLHNGGGPKWDSQAVHQVFPGKNTILGTFDCADIGGGEMGDRTMSWLASSTQGFELEYLQAGVGDDADFEKGIGAWIVACQ